MNILFLAQHLGPEKIGPLVALSVRRTLPLFVTPWCPRPTPAPPVEPTAGPRHGRLRLATARGERARRERAFRGERWRARGRARALEHARAHAPSRRTARVVRRAARRLAERRGRLGVDDAPRAARGFRPEGERLLLERHECATRPRTLPRASSPANNDPRRGLSAPRPSTQRSQTSPPPRGASSACAAAPPPATPSAPRASTSARRPSSSRTRSTSLDVLATKAPRTQSPARPPRITIR